MKWCGENVLRNKGANEIRERGRGSEQVNLTNSNPGSHTVQTLCMDGKDAYVRVRVSKIQYIPGFHHKAPSQCSSRRKGRRALPSPWPEIHYK